MTGPTRLGVALNFVIIWVLAAAMVLEGLTLAEVRMDPWGVLFAAGLPATKAGFLYLALVRRLGRYINGTGGRT